MPVVICPNTSNAYKIPDDTAGKRLRCPHCQVLYIGEHPAKLPVVKLPAPAVPAPPPPARNPAPPAPPTPVSSRSRRRYVMATGIVAIVAVLGIAGTLVGRALFGSADAPDRLVVGPGQDKKGGNDNRGAQPEAKDAKVIAVDPKSTTPEPKIEPPIEKIILPPLPTFLDDDETLVFRLQIQPVNKMLESLRFLAKTANRSEMFEQFVNNFPVQFGTSGPPHIGKDKPLGAYVQLINGKDVRPVLLVPVDDKVKFLRSMNYPEEPNAGDQYSFKYQQLSQAIGLRFAHGYAYFTLGDQQPRSDADLLKPAQVFASAEKAIASAAFRVDRLPPTKRANGLIDLDDQVGALKRFLVQGRTKAQSAFALKCMDSIWDLRSDLSDGSKEVFIRLVSNPDTNQVALEFGLTAIEKSRLAEKIESIGRMSSFFGALGEGDAAFRFLSHLRMSDELAALWAPMARELTEIVLRDEKDPVALREGKRVFGALQPTIDAGELDVGMVMRKHGDDPYASVVGGIKAPSGPELGKILRQKVDELPDKKDRDLYQWDADRVDDVSLHRMLLSGLDFPEFKHVFGDQPALLAFRKDAVLWSAGPHGRTALQKAIRAAPKAAPPFLLELSLKDLLEILPLTGKENPLALKHLSQANPGRFQVSLHGGSSLRLRVNLDRCIIPFVMESLPPVQFGVEKKGIPP